MPEEELKQIRNVAGDMVVKMLEESDTDIISHIQELNLYDPNNALITASLLSPGPAQVDSRSGRGTSFSP